ncbi:hypothetical protein [Kitasatospora sp. NBC_01300]|uniref:hypothetical protein n=1 Tax=Kitasatospora sp. NBC_01300 TaxID=2903574 RepID=UPI00352E7BA9|nr:hypothetical protein OG556_40345 [Kitasatospora sp. NBC_01300]
MSAQASPKAQQGGGRQVPTPPIPAQTPAEFAQTCRAHADRVAEANTGTGGRG